VSRPPIELIRAESTALDQAGVRMLCDWVLELERRVVGWRGLVQQVREQLDDALNDVR
jgi:hypothetical protein